MGKEPIGETLVKLPFFADMERGLVDLFADCARELHCGHGHYLSFEGDAADSLFVILEGSVALQANAGSLGFLSIEMLGPGDMIGWSWLFPPYRWTLTARAQSPTRYISFDARCLRGKCEDNIDLTYELMKRTAAVSATRLRAARYALLEQLA